MPIQAVPNYTPIPTPVIQRGDRATFSDRVDAAITWLQVAPGQVKSIADVTYNNAVIAEASATTAVSAKDTAVASATQALSTVPFSGPTPPLNPAPNAVWIDSDTYRKYTYLPTASGFAWVEADASVVYQTPISAADQTYTASGTGATARSTLDKLREQPVTPQDFMTAEQKTNVFLRLGTLNVTAAVQAALNAGAGRLVRLPAGVYGVTGDLIVPRGTMVEGDGWTAVLKVLPGSNPATVLKVGDESAPTPCELNNFKIDGNKAENQSGGHGINIVRPIDANMYKMHVRNCHGDGVKYEAVGSSFQNYIYETMIYGCDGVGFRMLGQVTDTHIKGGDIGYNGVAGVVLATSCSIDGTTIWGAGLGNATGVITAGSSSQIMNTKIEGHGKHGLHITAGSHFMKISNNKIYANSFNAVTSGAYDAIYVEAGADFGTITANDIYSSLSNVDTFLMRYAINFAGAHGSWKIAANILPHLGVAGAASTGRVVNGVLETDKFDFNWSNTNIKSRRSASMTASAAFVWTVLPFDTDDLDPLAEFANGVFTPKNSGRYRIEVAYTCTAAAAGENLGLALYTNAGTVIRRITVIRSQGTSSEMVSGSIDEFLTAGTAYDIRYLTGSTATNILAGPEFTYLRIRPIPN